MLRLIYYIIAIVVVLAIQTEGSCLKFRPKERKAADGTVLENYCEHEGKVIEVGQKASFPHPTCLDCTCFQSGLSCCVYGYYASSNSLPKDCKLVPPNSCEAKAVKKNDPSKPC